jgi:branched-chain amino acid transport system substrate-binding protein
VIPALAAAAGLVLVTGAVAGSSGSGRISTLPSSSCGKLIYGGKGSPQYLIASDLPLQGATRPQTIQMTKAIQFILQGRKYTAGKYTIGYQSCDDSTAQRAAWDSAKCTANAQAYASERSLIAIIGTFNSGCAKLVIPILNRAPGGPLGMISPANTAVGLTHAGNGSSAGEPRIYYPTGKRNYVRIVAADDIQGPADAMLVQRLKKKSVYIVTDNETYGKGVAITFQSAAQKLGIDVKGFEAWDAKASSYEALGTKIKASGAESVFFGGIVCNNGAKLIKDIRAAVGPDVSFVGPDGFTPFSAVVSGAGEAANGMFVSVAGLPLEKLGPAGKKFVTDFVKYQKRPPDPYAAYAAQAADVLLDAIARSNGTRPSVVQQLFRTNVKGGILGTFRIDKNGDVHGKPITIYQLPSGKTYVTLFPPDSLTK